MRKLIKWIYKRGLLKKKNVCGLGLGYKIVDGNILDLPCITVAVEKKEDVKKKDIIPDKIMGVPTDVVEVGKLEQLKWRDKHRPCRLGSSCSSEKVTACSLGLPLYDEDGNKYLLMNEHCTHPDGQPSFDAILQPAPADGGTLKDQIGVSGNLLFGVSSKKKNNKDSSLCPLTEEIDHKDVVGEEYIEETEPVTQKHILKDILGGGRTIGRLARGILIAYDFEARVWGEENGKRVVRHFKDCVLAVNADEEGPIVMGGDSSSIRFVDGKPLLQTFAGSEVSAIFNQTYKSKKFFEKLMGKKLTLEKPTKGYVAVHPDWLDDRKTKVNLNLRESPGGKIIKTMPKGTIIETEAEYKDGYFWIEIEEK